MRVKLVTLAAALLPLVMPLVLPGHASSSDLLSPAGLWQALDDDTKQPSGWFLITDHGGVYDGIIAKMFFKPGENPNPSCDQCKDDRHDHPWLGLEIIRGMKPEGEAKFAGGTILDPRDGKIYHATMKVSPDGGTPDGARLYRHRAVGTKSILDAVAGFGHQPARSVGQSERRRRQASCCSAVGA